MTVGRKTVTLRDVCPGDLLILTDWLKDNDLDGVAGQPLVYLRRFPPAHRKVLEQYLPWVGVRPWRYFGGAARWRGEVKCFSRRAVWNLLKKAGVSAPSNYYHDAPTAASGRKTKAP